VTLSSYLDERRQAVETALDACVPSPLPTPTVITGAMRYSLLGGGKRLRPLLVLAACEAVQRSEGPEAWEPALPAACAVEMIHTYSLIHDDLPAMDDDALRRGRPTSHVVHGEGMAILAGDGLQAEAFALLARLPAGTHPALLARKLQTLQVIAEAAGAAGMVGGQALDLAADPSQARRTHPTRPAPAPLDADALTDMHARKTGALIRASVLAGAIMGGATAPALACLDRYAREIGLAFQIVDDILDVEGSADELGKSAGKDAASGKLTYPALYGLDESRRLAEACADRARGALAGAGIAGHLPAIVDWTLTRRG